MGELEGFQPSQAGQAAALAPTLPRPRQCPESAHEALRLRGIDFKELTWADGDWVDCWGCGKLLAGKPAGTISVVRLHAGDRGKKGQGKKKGKGKGSKGFGVMCRSCEGKYR